MSRRKQGGVVKSIALVLVISLSASGCSSMPKPSLSMPSLEKIFGSKKQTDEPQVAEESLDAPDQMSGSPMMDDPMGQTYQSTGPATISPYDQNMSQSGQPMPTSQVGMGSVAAPQPQGNLSSEDIARMAQTTRSVPRNATGTIRDVEVLLRDSYRIYTPRGKAPYPTVLFYHGCSGTTIAQERDWASFYTSLGYAMIAVDSISPREINWQDVCSMGRLNPAERAADVFASLRFARSLPIIDANRLVLAGFDHGASTIWASLLLASGQTPPTGMREFPRDALNGVRAAYMFYAPCLAPWTVNVPAVTFLGGNDKFVDSQTCVKHARRITGSTVSFDYEIFPGATHTFDHRSPNDFNRSSGSVYDAKATERAREMIKDHLSLNVSG